MQSNNLHRLAGLRHLDGGRAARCAAPVVHRRGQAAHRHHLHRASQRCRAHVHRHAGAERGDRVDAQPVGHGVCCAPFSTWTRSSGSSRRPRIRRPSNRCSRCSSRRAHSVWAACSPRQNPVDLDYKGLAQLRHLVHRPAADRARQAARHRRPEVGAAGRRGRHGSRSADVEPHAARVPDAQCARRRAGAHEDALGVVLPARPAHRPGDRTRDGAREGRRGRDNRSAPPPSDAKRRGVSGAAPRSARRRVRASRNISCRPRPARAPCSTSRWSPASRKLHFVDLEARTRRMADRWMARPFR